MDNKYANLPGIARNEPDVYETTNLVPSANNDHGELNEDNSQNVEKIKVTPKEAREKYSGSKPFNSELVDFSDAISNRRKFGYRVEPENFEWNQDAIETPLERFKRLERDLNELRADIKQMREEGEGSGNETLDKNGDLVELIKQVEGLQKQTAELHMESLGLKSNASLDDKTKKQLLLENLNQIKAKLHSKPQAQADGKGKPDVQFEKDAGIVFKLFADLDFDDLQQAKRISDLTQRLAGLEKLFGTGNFPQVSERQIGTLCANIDNKSILGLIENLSSRVDLINSQSIEQLDSRLQMIVQRVNQLNDKKAVIEDQEKLQRVNELYSIIVRWKDFSAAVPTIVERLSALNELHEKAFQFASILTRLDSDQQAIKEKLGMNSEVLTNLKKNMDDNLESIKANFEVLNKRIASIGSA